MKKFNRILISLIISLLFVISAAFPACAQILSMEIKGKQELTAYSDYAKDAKSDSGEAYLLGADNISDKQGDVQIVSDYQGRAGSAVKTAEGSKLSWKLDCPDGWYTLKVTYYVEECRSNYAQRKLTVNGKVPFDEAAELCFYCAYIDENGIMSDFYGNDIRSTQTVKPMWRTVNVYDKVQYQSTPLKFHLKKGDIFTFEADIEDMVIGSIELLPYKELSDYSAVKASYKENGYKEIGEFKEIYQAEKPEYKTDPTILPATDNNASTVPQDSYLVKLNKISGGNWKNAGQLINWKVNVPEDGLYSITLKAKQSTDRGSYSTRRVYVNGEVPFKEANNIKFLYSKNWQNVTLGNGEENWLFYLKKGENDIAVEAILGDIGGVLQKASNILEELNTVYRELLVVIGSSPDKYRDYDLDKLLPDTLSNLKTQRDNLEAVLNEIYDITGQKGNNLSIFSTIINQLDEFIKDDEKIPSGFSYFKTNIGSFGTWITTALQQPLDLDYIVVSSADTDIPKANVGLFKKFANWVTSFVASFVVDYDSIGNLSANKTKPITVWMTSGRDQMQILKVLIQNSFIQKTGINVQLENVEAGAILKAIAAGNGPDALIGAGMADPVNYALRNAALNLNKFKDIEDVKSRFYDETLVPFTFGGGLYALPEVLSFKVMFYRTDVLNEMKLEVPETWDDVTIVTSTLQKNNMTFGLPAPDIIGTYATFLYQMGGELYNKDGSKCLLTDAVNTEAFEIMSNYYKNYALELSYNLVNRFRTGEMPIAIDDISVYNNLKVSAPEIEGLWGMSLLPGTLKKDGTIDRTGYVGSTAAMVLGSSDMPKEAFEFIKWWTTKEIQSDYGKELESILGPSSRYLTANKEAFENLPWNEAELKVIEEQLNKSRAVPQVPGSYYLTRHLNNAFRAIVISKEDLRDTLSEYNATINEELYTKRKEFNLN